jgi:hypothetical protein
LICCRENRWLVSLGMVDIGIDKLEHFAACCILQVLFAWLLIRFRRLPLPWAILLASLPVFAIGFVKEVVDGTLLQRRFDDEDLLADVLGLTVGALIVIGIVMSRRFERCWPSRSVQRSDVAFSV